MKARERTEWAVAIGVDVAVMVVGMALVILAQRTAMADLPWTYIGSSMVVLAALGAMALGVANADFQSHHPDKRWQHR